MAVKISAAQFTERFQREARAVAALNHPNICQLYDVGPNYLVMELVEGPTLAERIKEGALPLDEALGLARQISDALDAAHEKGIVHRDLKPGNIKIKPDGTVKVLDFGLAKIGGTPAAASPENSPTISMAATQAGVILGTAAYMSPEQARGKEVDKRADVWAFGVVLYEMLTGEKLFQGTDVTDTLAAVLRHEPDFDRVPAKVRRLLRRCLEKDPGKRLRGIGDAMELLEDAPVLASPSRTGRPSRLKYVSWIAAGVLLTAAAATSWMVYRSAPPALQPLVRLEMDLGNDLPNPGDLGNGAILSPDGARFVYIARGRLFTRRLDQSNATEMAGTQGASEPFFSPDGQWVAFYAQAALKKISIDGGAPVTLCSTGTLTGGAWGGDGNIVAALAFDGPLSRVPSTGGQPTPVTELTAGEITHRWPQLLPGGKAVLFTAHSNTNGFDAAHIDVFSFADHRRKTLQRGATFGRYVAVSKGAGYLLYVNSGTLFAAPFDPNALELRGTPAPVLDRVAYAGQWGSTQLDVSPSPGSGTLIYRSGGAAGNKLSTVQWLDPAGKTQPLLAKPGAYYTPRLAPDGRRLALAVREGSNGDIWVYEPQRDTMTRLTFSGSNQNPTWTPDGRYIVFEGAGGIFWTRSDGAGQPQPLTKSKGRQVPYSFTPDGATLAFFAVSQTGRVFTVPLKTTNDSLSAGVPEAFFKSSSSVERHPTFSPDGRWLAYSSNESGVFQVYVRAFPDKGGKWQISNAGGGLYPQWSRNGRDLFYRNSENRLGSGLHRQRRFLCRRQAAVMGSTAVAGSGLQRSHLRSGLRWARRRADSG